MPQRIPFTLLFTFHYILAGVGIERERRWWWRWGGGDKSFHCSFPNTQIKSPKRLKMRLFLDLNLWKKLLFHHYTGSLSKWALTGSRAELFKNVSSSSQASEYCISTSACKGKQWGPQWTNFTKRFKVKPPKKNHFQTKPTSCWWEFAGICRHLWVKRGPCLYWAGRSHFEKSRKVRERVCMRNTPQDSKVLCPEIQF